MPVQQNTRASKAKGADGTVYVSATAVVCGSCHINSNLGLIDPANLSDLEPKQQALIDHMINNGAVFGASSFDAANKVESCSVCHAIGGEYGVDKVHSLK